ncbi:MAG: DUF362 domain-containing protein [Candidatus Bathyarchaeota archaeon]
MRSTVYYGSIVHGQSAHFASLAAKYEEMMTRLDLSTISKGDKVAVKMHLGFRDGFQTVPVFFVRRLVKRLKDVGAYPFVTDNPTAVYNAVDRGYTQETCGCPIIPVSGVKDGYRYETMIGYRTVDKMNMGGALHDADALINLVHVKGHQTCGYGGAFKNLALGGYCGEDRWHKIHGVEDSVPWYSPEKLTSGHAEKLEKACPCGALRYDPEKRTLTNLWYECMNGNCLECIEADRDVGALSLTQANFAAFQELMAVATGKILETFSGDKVFHLGFLLDITPQCDCPGLISPPVVPDIGIVAGRDIVAVEQAALDLVARAGLIPQMIPPYIKKTNLDPEAPLHPFQRLWGAWKDPYLVCGYGEKLGLGSRDYTLEEILPPEETVNMQAPNRVFERQPTFY